MLLVTGATGTVGRALVNRLVAADRPVRCLVRDPTKLGDLRARVQIAIADLAEPPLPRAAMRGVETVVHLASANRDADGATIEEVVVGGTARLVAAARAAGVERFVFFSALGARPWARPRLLRAKAVAEQIVRESGLRATIVRPSLVYARGDRYLQTIEACARGLGFVPLIGRGTARYRPIWADDVAACAQRLVALTSLPATVELCGPELLTQRQFCAAVLEALGLGRPLVPMPWPLVHRVLAWGSSLAGDAVPAPDEAELLLESGLCVDSTAADVRSLGVEPLPVARVLS